MQIETPFSNGTCFQNNTGNAGISDSSRLHLAVLEALHSSESPKAHGSGLESTDPNLDQGPESTKSDPPRMETPFPDEPESNDWLYLTGLERLFDRDRS